ncbi:MAG: SH3 domain-containing protein [Trichocoleus desertorum ATA4-8-CV12]|jgi:hypothetical protein|nr:SH3 domain-containing protein [Trichocoleus desertorum ATA4-8-CV12]
MLNLKKFIALWSVPIAVLAVAFASLPAIAQLRVGNLSEIEGDITCGRGTGGTLAYAETKNYLVYICGTEGDPTAPRFYRSRTRDGSQGLNLEAVNYDPRQMRYFEFTNNGYTYVLQMPMSQIPNPVLAVEFPNGKRVEERVLRYLARIEVGNSNPAVCSFITANQVNIRRGPSTNYPVLTQLNRARIVRALNRQGNWVKIVGVEDPTTERVRALNGWVSNAYINGCSEDQFDRWRR